MKIKFSANHVSIIDVLRTIIHNFSEPDNLPKIIFVQFKFLLMSASKQIFSKQISVK